MQLSEPGTQLTAQGLPLDMSAHAFGTLRSSIDIQNDACAQRERMEEDGYLYIPGFFPRELIHEARRSFLRFLHKHGHLHPGHPWEDGIAAPDFENNKIGNNPKDLVSQTALLRVVFGPEIISFYSRFLEGEICYFDYIWARILKRAVGTVPHCDLVFMGRGTFNLYTAWIPYGDISIKQGGLILLEKSHKQSRRIRNYLSHDVDTYCENRPTQKELVLSGKKVWIRHGTLSKNPVTLQEKFGGRWLTAPFRMGDLLTFRMDMVHASLDNQTDALRFSTDTRYQLASEPIDDRWVGENPPGHGLAGKRGLIC